MVELGGGGITSLWKVPTDAVSKSCGSKDEIADVKAAGTFAAGVSREGPAWSSSPSSSALTLSSTWVANAHEELPGSKAWVPQGWVPGMNACILR